MSSSSTPRIPSRRGTSTSLTTGESNTPRRQRPASKRAEPKLENPLPLADEEAELPSAVEPMKATPGVSNQNAVDPLHLQVCGRVRELRKQRGWTLEQLASLSGVSRSMLSQIERGHANPTLGVAFRIAQAFGLSLGDLVDQVDAPPKIDVIRSEDPTFWFRDDDECRIRTLSPLHLEKDVEFYEIRLGPGKSLKSAPHFHGTREFLAVKKGSVRLTAGDESQELHKGDSAHFPADVSHCIENLGRGEAVAFLVDIYARHA